MLLQISKVTVPTHPVLEGAEAMIEPMAQPSGIGSAAMTYSAPGLRCRNPNHQFRPQMFFTSLIVTGRRKQHRVSAPR